jgi:GNAT superfamily N-acetyltransferase
MVIRLATLSDVDAIVAMGLAFLRQSDYRTHIAENPDQMRVLAHHLLNSPDGAFFVADHDGRLVGVLGIIAYAHHMSGERTAGELVWWVDPAKRGIGLRLLKAAEQWAKDQGAVTLQMIAPTEDVERLYTRLGFSPVERTYQRRIA